MRNERGFTLIEILVSLAIFAVIVIGSIGVLGAANAGGFLEGFPTGFMTARVARDYTAASVFLQAFQEYAAERTSLNAPDGLYCVEKEVGTCATPTADELRKWCPAADTAAALGSYTVGLPAGWTAPSPPDESYQLRWTTQYVLIETWYWNSATSKYSPTAPVSIDKLKRVCTTLNWQFQNASRPLTVERFIP